jgi:hypothetical protein
MAEVQKDLQAFDKAFDAINERVLERQEAGTADLLHFAEWPGTVAALNVLIMCRTRCEGILEDLRNNLEHVPHGLASVEDKEDGQNE